MLIAVYKAFRMILSKGIVLEAKEDHLPLTVAVAVQVQLQLQL